MTSQIEPGGNFTVREILQLLDDGTGELGVDAEGMPVLRVMQTYGVATRYIQGMLDDGLIRKDTRGKLVITDRGRQVGLRRII